MIQLRYAFFNSFLISDTSFLVHCHCSLSTQSLRSASGSRSFDSDLEHSIIFNTNHMTRSLSFAYLVDNVFILHISPTLIGPQIFNLKYSNKIEKSIGVQILCKNSWCSVICKTSAAKMRMGDEDPKDFSPSTTNNTSE